VIEGRSEAAKTVLPIAFDQYPPILMVPVGVPDDSVQNQIPGKSSPACTLCFRRSIESTIQGAPYIAQRMLRLPSFLLRLVTGNRFLQKLVAMA